MVLGLAAGTRRDVRATAQASLTLLETRDDAVVLELDVPGVTLSPSHRLPGTQTVYVPGLDGVAGEPGQPRLPATSTLVAIPPGADVSLQILEDRSQQVATGIHLEPMPFEEPESARHFLEQPEALDRLANPLDAYVGTHKVYAPAAARPTRADFRPARLVERGYLRDQAFVRVVLEPLEYREDGSLYLHRRLRIAIRFDPAVS
ncbi:MAG: hypothetical protein D6791_05130, partial [Chloroflexi bacterium]